ncbi:MAG: hypothetical protein HY674_15225 [Chloroflexi bacterium]|nr:hypothetical protein [Chloroflexota bacterium]
MLHGSLTHVDANAARTLQNLLESVMVAAEERALPDLEPEACRLKTEAGLEQALNGPFLFAWLRIDLDLLRQRAVDVVFPGIKLADPIPRP